MLAGYFHSKQMTKSRRCINAQYNATASCVDLHLLENSRLSKNKCCILPSTNTKCLCLGTFATVVVRFICLRFSLRFFFCIVGGYKL